MNAKKCVLSTVFITSVSVLVYVIPALSIHLPSYLTIGPTTYIFLIAVILTISSILLSRQIRISKYLSKKVKEIQNQHAKMVKMEPELDILNRREVIRYLNQLSSINQSSINPENTIKSRKNRLPIILFSVDEYDSIQEKLGFQKTEILLKELFGFIKTLTVGMKIGNWYCSQFIIITPSLHHDDLLIMAENIRYQISQHTFSDDLHLSVRFALPNVFIEQPYEYIVKDMQKRLLQ